MYKEYANQKLIKSTTASINYDAKNMTLKLDGAWLWASINENDIDKELANISSTTEPLTIDGSAVVELDTCGIYFVNKIIQYLKDHDIKLSNINLPNRDDKIFDLIQAKLNQPKKMLVEQEKIGVIAAIGEMVSRYWDWFASFIIFFGQFCTNLISLLKSPLSLKWSEVSRTINDAGVKGTWVVALLCFLIGVTLAYEMSPQFITYGANVYIVNFLGISLLKEVAPLLTAVIVAGRTGASIAAEIGTQVLQEEVDALKTMGISPMRRIVLPKVVGVMIAVPLITAIGDIASMVGGAVIAKPMLGISYSLFLARMQAYLATSNYSCGIIKSVAFAFLIALGGCFCGFNVKGNANSIGEQTTNSVVLGIILVIFCDAIFAIIFNVLGL